MKSRKIAINLGGIAVGALALTAAPAYADTVSGHDSVSGHQPATTSSHGNGHEHGNRHDGSRTAVRIVRFDATPNRVHRGGHLHLKGTLRSQSGHEYGQRLDHLPIYVSFRSQGSRDWRDIGAIRTGANGAFSTRVQTQHSGTWRVQVDDGRRGDSTAYDYVTVIR